MQARAAGITTAVATFGTQPSGQRHPLVATAMVLPVALLLAALFGGFDAVATQASSVAGMLQR
ncbi:hypothetical protein JGS22_020465 [Streptomyces sp. P38-E01]|uniref:Uncharacterized protein n=1 Tax=Streptomyces tardus TaxID=2780544 RepID=A0A949JJM8_9ACTN|nr:hypothetical protein [Streptomyces tardus]